MQSLAECIKQVRVLHIREQTQKEDYMGYGIRDRSIRTYWPDDNEKTIYIAAAWQALSLQEIMDKAQEKWPGCSLSDISITAEYIHTDCLSYDQYDSSDYTNFIVITKI